MLSKLNNWSFFMAVKVALIYILCWIPFSFLSTSSISSAASGEINIGQLNALPAVVYLFLATVFVFLLIKRQFRKFVLTSFELANSEGNHKEPAYEPVSDQLNETGQTDRSGKSIENKKLFGIIPICARCKNVRNEKGAWEQIESYIRNRTGVSFSHTLCPGCEERLYGKDKKAYFSTIAGKYL
jgi:hypothetical protein